MQDDLDGARKRCCGCAAGWWSPATDWSDRAELKEARGGLADRLVELYKADQPDALTVVLEADGFNDLLERTDFLERISDQDRGVIRKVRVLKARAEQPESQLAGLERKRQVAAETILRRRDDIAATRDRLATAQGDLRSARNGRRTSGQRPAATAATPRRTSPRWRASRRRSAAGWRRPGRERRADQGQPAG